MAMDLWSGSVRIVGNCGDDCSTSDVMERHMERQHQHQQEEEQRPGGSSTQVVGLKDVEGGAVLAAEKCVALLMPKELSRRIFSQLDYRDLIQCSLVCKQWHLETSELRQGWKEEFCIEACTIRGVQFNYRSASPDFSHLHLYLAGSPD